ncbi:MAG: VCBS repeat-containing protein [Candidatus Eisenbacteria bacterium]|nr:VCBS repeat-containing protein [Candidatus Eisenbacteria bacterium]
MKLNSIVVAGLAMLAPIGAQAISFTDVSVAAGVSIFSNVPWGAGVAWVDFEGDGDLDLLMVDGQGDAHRAFRNNGNGTFTDVAAAIGLLDTGYGKAYAPADFDNDGDADVLLTNYDTNQINRLWRNNGNGTFTDISVGSGFDYKDQSTGAAWADYDNDGDLDCSITTYGFSHRDRLMRNDGNGVFVDVAIALGVHDPTGWGYQPGWFDYDNDGDVDLYYANDNFFGGTGNKLYRNNGNGTFTDVSVASGANLAMSAMGLAFGDYDHDLDLDIYISNIMTGNRLLRNNGNGTFTEVAAASGVAVNQICWSVDFVDMDHDTWEDIFAAAFGNTMQDPDGTPDFVFENMHDGTFMDVSAASNADNGGVTYASAWGDYDTDGDLDLVITNYWDADPSDLPNALYRNEAISPGNPSDSWLQVELIGTVSNRDAVGARVTVEIPGATLIREQQSGTGYLSSSQHALHFGLGSATEVSTLTVRWPAGGVQTLTNVAGGQKITIVEGGSADVAPVAAAQQLFVSPNPFRGSTEIRLASALAGGAQIRICDASGRAVRSLEAGASTTWDGRADGGAQAPAGIYYIRLESNGRLIETRKVTLVN